MDPEIRERLLRLRFLPTRPELSDREVAARLDSGQPHLQAARESAARGGAAALRRALAEHLDACVLSDARDVRFPADWYDARSGDVQDAEAILRGRIAFVGKVLDVGARIDWHAWDYPCAESRFVRWFWMHPLVSAYRTTGHARYARGAMDIVRAFYADARPPAQRPVTWYGYNGPWQALMAAGRVPIAIDLYRTIGRSDALDGQWGSFEIAFRESGLGRGQATSRRHRPSEDPAVLAGARQPYGDARLELSYTRITLDTFSGGQARLVA